MSVEDRGATLAVFTKFAPSNLAMPLVVELVLIVLFALSALDAYYILALPVIWGASRHLIARVVVFEKGLKIGFRFLPWELICDAGIAAAPGTEGKPVHQKLVLALSSGSRIGVGPGYRELGAMFGLVHERMSGN